MDKKTWWLVIGLVAVVGIIMWIATMGSTQVEDQTPVETPTTVYTTGDQLWDGFKVSYDCSEVKVSSTTVVRKISSEGATSTAKNSEVVKCNDNNLYIY